jgi:hypothetical protein
VETLNYAGMASGSQADLRAAPARVQEAHGAQRRNGAGPARGSKPLWSCRFRHEFGGGVEDLVVQLLTEAARRADPGY